MKAQVRTAGRQFANGEAVPIGEAVSIGGVGSEL
jgi:hypothetical protein